MRHHSAVVGFFRALVSFVFSLCIEIISRTKFQCDHLCTLAWQQMLYIEHSWHRPNISKTLSLIDNVRCQQKKYRLHYDKCRWESWCCLEPQESEIEKPASSFFTHLHGKSNSNKTNSKHSVDMALNVLRWFITDSVSTVSNSWYGAIPSANVSQLHWFTMCLFWPSQLKFNFCR